MVAEHAPLGKRAFYSGFPQVGPAAGYLLSAAIFLLLVSPLSEAQFAAWGWRVPFLFSIVLVGIGLFVRSKLAERRSSGGHGDKDRGPRSHPGRVSNPR
jgi:MFS family permease